MRVVELSDVCQVSKRKVAPEDIQHGTPYVGLEHINPDGFYLTELVEEGELKSTKNVFKPGQILFGKLRPYLRKTALAVSPGICSTDVIVLDPKDVVSPQYLTYFLRQDSTVQLATERCSGANLPRISPKELMRFDFPLPPLEEQKRIAGILDEADRVRKKTQALIDKYDELAQSLFLDMFGDPVTNPKGWEKVQLQYLCEKIMGGGTPSKGNKDFYNGIIPWVTPKDMKFDFITRSIDTITEDAVANSSAKLIPRHSVLMVIRSGILKHTLPLSINEVQVCVNQDLKAFIPNDDVVRCNYLFFLLRSCEKYLLQKVRAVTADNIEFRQIKTMKVPRPPMSIQLRFDEALIQLRSQRKAAKLQQELAEGCFNALLQKAFKGELT